jgi:hypothetical protein
MKHDFEERKQRRIDNANARAAKADKESTAAYNRASEISSYIPMGQPILVGHHSEKRHRRDLEKIDNNMRKSVQLSDKADYYREKAEAIEAAAEYVISSDDPNALEKLRTKLENMQKMQELMKAANKAIKKNFGKLDQQIEALKELNFSDEGITKLLTKDCFSGIGFASYKMTNNNANMKRVKDRIANLEQIASLEQKEVTIPGTQIKFVQNVEANRVQFIFPGKPDDATRSELKSRGFRWAPSEGAWQRQLNGNGQWAAKHIINFLTHKTQ